MIDSDGNARILDFGLAGLSEELPESELAAGTPAYMAPEQLAGKEQTAKTDNYCACSSWQNRTELDWTSYAANRYASNCNTRSWSVLQALCRTTFGRALPWVHLRVSVACVCSSSEE